MIISNDPPYILDTRMDMFALIRQGVTLRPVTDEIPANVHPLPPPSQSHTDLLKSAFERISRNTAMSSEEDSSDDEFQ